MEQKQRPREAVTKTPAIEGSRPRPRSRGRKQRRRSNPLKVLLLLLLCVILAGAGGGAVRLGQSLISQEETPTAETSRDVIVETLPQEGAEDFIGN